MFDSHPSDDAAVSIGAAVESLLGVELAAALVELIGIAGSSGLSPFEAVEAITGFEKVARWAQARKLALLGQLGDERGVASSPDDALLLGSEVSLALGVSRQAADALVADAVALRTRLPMVLAALESGRVCERAVHVIVAETAVLDAPGAARVATAVLDRPDLRTVPRVRALTRAAVLRADPATAEQREARAVKSRFVRADHCVEDGMVGWTAWLPAADSMRIWSRLRTLGDASRTPDDHRGGDARRADVLCDLLLGRPVSTIAGDVVDTVNPAGRSVWRTDLVVEASTLQGRDDHPGFVPSWGPVTAATARRIAAGHTGAVARPASVSTRSSGEAGCGATEQSGGARHDPPEADAQWRRILTEPVTGLVTDYGTTRYRPPQALADLIRARDGRCYEPSCTVTAWRADLDHIRPSPAGPSPRPDADGRTSAGNLAPACRRHHRTKQSPGWAVEADPHTPGAYTWTTPTGHTHVRHPEPAVPWLGSPFLHPPLPPPTADQPDQAHPVPGCDGSCAEPPPERLVEQALSRVIVEYLGVDAHDSSADGGMSDSGLGDGGLGDGGLGDSGLGYGGLSDGGLGDSDRPADGDDDNDVAEPPPF